MTGPGDGTAAAGCGHLRASHAEREHVVGVLKTAFVQGRLTKDELELRAGQAFISRTYAELTAVTADLPAGLTADPPRGPIQARPQVNSNLRAAAIMVTTVAVLTVILWAAAFLTQNNGVIEVTFLATLADFAIVPMVMFVAAAQAIDARQRERAGGQVLPPPPSSRGTGGGRSGRAAPAGPAHRIMSAIAVIVTRSA